MPDLQDPEIYRTALDSLQTGVCLMDPGRKIFFWNEGAERVTGYQRHDVVGHDCRQNVLPHCDGRACDSCGAACPIARSVLEGKSTHARIELRHKEGHRIPIRVWVVPIRDQHGLVIGVAQSFDRQIQGNEERRQKNLATYGCLDEVTGVPNHSFTEFHLQENLESFSKYHLPFGVMLIQVDALDHFRSAYGREAADAILRVTAQTMKNALRPSDFLGRWEGTQFLAILMNSTGPGVHAAAERIRKLVSCAGLQWWGDELVVTASLGSTSVQAGDTITSLLERALHSIQHGRAKHTSAAASSDSSATGR
jgi:diguanylate cyclase (GGDEF)-like protein/PAS domain S-box-containing protein